MYENVVNVYEKVVAGLECCIKRDPDDKPRCAECPYDSACLACLNRLKIDALELLKTQEPVTPHMVDWGIYECPKCKTRVDKTYKFCKHCGRMVKWGA